jgi:ribosomal protein S18 acetylase RimI-like enzyme
VPGREVAARLEVVQAVTADLVDAFARLLPQLSRTAPALSRQALDEIVSSPATALLVARDEAGTIVGSLTLVLFRIPTGVRAWIEDVVVDESARGRGIGEALTMRAIAIATERGARSVDLSSRPEREAANRLYQRLGFQPRDSRFFRFTP